MCTGKTSTRCLHSALVALTNSTLSESGRDDVVIHNGVRVLCELGAAVLKQAAVSAASAVMGSAAVGVDMGMCLTLLAGVGGGLSGTALSPIAVAPAMLRAAQMRVTSSMLGDAGSGISPGDDSALSLEGGDSFVSGPASGDAGGDGGPLTSMGSLVSTGSVASSRSGGSSSRLGRGGGAKHAAAGRTVGGTTSPARQGGVARGGPALTAGSSTIRPGSEGGLPALPSGVSATGSHGGGGLPGPGIGHASSTSSGVSGGGSLSKGSVHSASAASLRSRLKKIDRKSAALTDAASTPDADDDVASTDMGRLGVPLCINLINLATDRGHPDLLRTAVQVRVC